MPKSLDRCKINVGQSLEIRPVCLKYLRKTKIHGEHSQKISPVYLTANSWGTIPKIVPVFIQILNSSKYYDCRIKSKVITKHNNGKKVRTAGNKSFIFPNTFMPHASQQICDAFFN